jgi:peptide/nickel transport system permease protein
VSVILRRRVVRLVLVMILVTLFTSLMLELVPGSPAHLIAGEGASSEAIAQINHDYGFDKPIMVRYLDWMGNLVTGDLGDSYRTQEPVWDAIKSRAPITMQLAFGAIILALLLAVPLALLCAFRAGSVFDRVVDGFTSVVIAVPAFLSALVLVYFLSSRAGVLPVTGWASLTEDPIDNLKHAAIPTIALALPALAVFQRVLRADVIATLQQDHITLARAKGLSSTVIVLRHALRPSSFSLLTVAGIRVAELVGGTVIIESLFAIPGLGSLLVQAVLGRDMIVVQAVVVVIALTYLLINLIVDVSYQLLDPRVVA